jgi:isoleucyl-tRNA synthetase
MLAPDAADLRSILIVSAAELRQDAALDGAWESADVEGLKIQVQAAAGKKCERCWVHETSVGEIPEHPSICARCRDALSTMQAAELNDR